MSRFLMSAALISLASGCESQGPPDKSVMATLPVFVPIECVLEAAPNLGPKTVRLRFVNKGDRTAPILSWLVARDGDLTGELTNELFEVRMGAKDVHYIGKLVRRSSTRTDDDYVFVPVSEPLVVVVDLGRFYQMDATGQYDVVYEAYNSVHDGLVVIKSNAVTLNVK